MYLEWGSDGQHLALHHGAATPTQYSASGKVSQKQSRTGSANQSYVDRDVDPPARQKSDTATSLPQNKTNEHPPIANRSGSTATSQTYGKKHLHQKSPYSPRSYGDINVDDVNSRLQWHVESLKDHIDKRFIKLEATVVAISGKVNTIEKILTMSPGIMHSSVSSFSPSQSSSRHHSSSTPPHGSSVSLFPSQKIKTSKPDSMDDMSAKSMPSLEETMETTPNATVTMPVPNYSTMPGLHTQKVSSASHVIFQFIITF